MSFFPPADVLLHTIGTVAQVCRDHQEPFALAPASLVAVQQH